MKSLYLFVLLLICFSAQSQIEIKSKTFVAYREIFDVNKVYNKSTGERIKEADLIKLMHKFKKIKFAHIIDERGRFLKYEFDPNNPIKKHDEDSYKINVKENSPFPNFIFEAINGDIINLKELKGKTVLLRFEMYAKSFNQNEVKKIDKQIDDLSDGENQIVAIIVFLSNEIEIKENFDIDNTKFKVIPNGRNFSKKYDISNYPTTIIIDENGVLKKQFEFSSDVNLIE